jgi:hypothetical protein
MLHLKLVNSTEKNNIFWKKAKKLFAKGEILSYFCLAS